MLQKNSWKSRWAENQHFLRLPLRLRCRKKELVEAMDAGAQIESLQQTIYQSEGNSIELMDKLKEEGDSQETALDRIVLTEVLGTLNAKRA